MFISVRPPPGHLSKFARISRATCKCIAKLATCYSGYLEYRMHVWPRSNWTLPLFATFCTSANSHDKFVLLLLSLQTTADAFSRQTRKAATGQKFYVMQCRSGSPRNAMHFTSRSSMYCIVWLEPTKAVLSDIVIVWGPRPHTITTKCIFWWNRRAGL